MKGVTQYKLPKGAKRMKKVKLVSSNENKLTEFRRFGLPDIEIEKGKDLKEVNADPQTVILYKALEAGTHCMVEDTSLHIEGEEVGVNIRWLLDNLPAFNGRKAVWQVLLGYNNGVEIEIYEGFVSGRITDRFAENPQGFGFDCYFIPVGIDPDQTLTLFELEQIGLKDTHSARKHAVRQFLANKAEVKKDIQSISIWEGKYQ